MTTNAGNDVFDLVSRDLVNQVGVCKQAAAHRDKVGFFFCQYGFGDIRVRE